MSEIMFNGVLYRRYDHLYAVSACGKFLRGLLVTIPRIRKDGYLEVGRRRLAHRLVATCWVSNPSGSKHVHHINGNKSDNRAENLLWVSPKEHFVDHHKGNGKHQVSDATKQRLRELRLGAKTSELTKSKQRDASIRLGSKPPPRPVGYRCSSESVEKMRSRHRKNTACEVDGVSYRSYSEAGRILGIRPLTIRKRCLSAGFPNYRKR